MSQSVQPFHLAIPDAELADLRLRLERTRWPERETVDDWSQGVPLAQGRALIEHWHRHYDWRRCEARLNALGQFSTEIEGLPIHFLHARSRHEQALPMLLSHGWPGSVIEFLKVIGPLTDPTAHGGKAEDAFHLVIPSLPGFGFSGKPAGTGWGVARIAAAWATLMKRLGYTRYVAQGGDWGSVVTTQMGRLQPDGLAAIHVNLPIVLPAKLDGPFSDGEIAMLDALRDYERWDAGYSKQQSTRPQTIGYALADSPSGQALWIYEKFWKWMDCNGDPLSLLSADEILDNIMMYWLSNSAASSARLYWESYEGAFAAVPLALPVGCSVFAREIYRAPRSWVERCMPRLIHWNELDRGGHFAAFEQPALFIDELRSCFRTLR
ncbi:MAG: epoxide hydrolase [Xanthomonadaceae bacterium]|nr:epoxide hydrolase [Xanthomonadaceae bacterium]